MSQSRRYYIEIFLVSLAGLLLEISYTRVVAFKLFYYYTYLVIGFALLGIGSGGVLVAISATLRKASLDSIIALCAIAGSFATIAGYVIIAITPLNAFALWSSVSEPIKLLVLCGALFATFLSIGVIVATLLGRHPERVSRLYFADLIGAGVACALVVPLMTRVTPPGCVMIGAALLAVIGLVSARACGRQALTLLGGVGTLLGVLLAAYPSLLPDPVTDNIKTIRPDTQVLFSKWNPVFRIDVTESLDPDVRIIHHDGLWGSTLQKYSGDPSTLGRFDTDERSFAFSVADSKPKKVLIIGAAGGHEVLSAIHFDAQKITAVELNPATVSLVRTFYREYTGDIYHDERVDFINGEGRSFLARSDDTYDLIYFVAPDSYTSTSAATAGAFVLSESYLYTVEMITESLRHLNDGGVICMQFGEFAYEKKPNRTARYAATAREAFSRLGIGGFGKHVLVATTPGFVQLSTILLKRAPFTKSELARFIRQVDAVKDSKARYGYGEALDSGPVNKVIDLPDDKLADWLGSYAYDVSPVRDDSPFFWHFARFRTVVRSLGGKLAGGDTEDSVGERLLLAMVVVSSLYALSFLLLPFLSIRDVWRQLPEKGTSALYFASLGLAFMFFEISLIQKLTLFLGYPTYSLTVTLMALLVFAGIGAFCSESYLPSRRRAVLLLFGAVVFLMIFFQFGIDIITGALLGKSLAVRVTAAIACMAPLGIVLGGFMPLGLSTVADMTTFKNEYVAWGWAVNGFFSVLGSVTTTILSMTFGFRVVLFLAMVVYGIATLAFLRLESRLTQN